MAHKKGQGSTRNGRDSNPQRRGVKVYGGQVCTAGSIVVRQCGTKFHPGANMGLAKDFSLFALIDGRVRFESHRCRGKTFKRVCVDPLPAPAAAEPAKA